MDHFGSVDDFLAANYRTGLEEAPCDGCVTGRLGIVLADVATIAPVLVHSERRRALQHIRGGHSSVSFG